MPTLVISWHLYYSLNALIYLGHRAILIKLTIFIFFIMPTNAGIYIKLHIIKEEKYMNNNLNSRRIPKPKEVEPIKKPKDIEKIKQYFKGKENKRDYMLFVVGINIGLRAGDLLELNVKDVLIGKEVVDSVLIKEQKIVKSRELTLNKSAKDAIKFYLSNIKEYASEDYLFKSQKGLGHLIVEAIKGRMKLNYVSLFFLASNNVLKSF